MSTLQNAEDKDISATEVENEFEIEIEDDTPEEDRGRDPMPEEIVKNLEYDELDEFSKEKAKQLKKVWHDERRAKEAAARERDEAVKIAQRLAYENQSLKRNLGEGEKAYVGTTKEAFQRELQIAKRDFKEAYDSGDADRVAEAQDRLMSAKLKLQQVDNYRLQYNYDEAALQAEPFTIHNIQNQWGAVQEEPAQVTPDAKALAWQERNKWFGEDRVMTSFAFGLHEELVGSGVDPTSDEYYSRIDKEVRARFSDRFKADKKRPATVVASARRTTAPQRVRLTQTQVSLAKRLGLTPEQYAKEIIKLGDLNV